MAFKYVMTARVRFSESSSGPSPPTTLMALSIFSVLIHGQYPSLYAQRVILDHTLSLSAETSYLNKSHVFKSSGSAEYNISDAQCAFLRS